MCQQGWKMKLFLPVNTPKPLQILAEDIPTHPQNPSTKHWQVLLSILGKKLNCLASYLQNPLGCYPNESFMFPNMKWETRFPKLSLVRKYCQHLTNTWRLIIFVSVPQKELWTGISTRSHSCCVVYLPIGTVYSLLRGSSLTLSTAQEFGCEHLCCFALNPSSSPADCPRCRGWNRHTITLRCCPAGGPCSIRGTCSCDRRQSPGTTLTCILAHLLIRPQTTLNRPGNSSLPVLQECK